MNQTNVECTVNIYKILWCDSKFRDENFGYYKSHKDDKWCNNAEIRK